MTREEQIYNVAISDCDLYGEDNHFQFTRGAKWADEHPKEGMVSIDKVIEWLDNNFMNLIWGATRSVYSGNFATVDEMIESFNNAMRK